MISNAILYGSHHLLQLSVIHRSLVTSEVRLLGLLEHTITYFKISLKMSNLADVPALKLVSGRKSYSNKVILDGVDITVEKGTM